MYSISAEFCNNIPSWYVTENYISPLIGINPFCLLDKIEDFCIDNDLYELNDFLVDLRFDFKIDPLEYLKVNKKAIVITDFKRRVVWSSFSFELMTGYKRNEVLNKNLNFLQRKNNNQFPNSLSQQINNGENIKIWVLNHKKNGTKYLCEIEIYPLYNYKNEIVYFIAFETNLDK